jgi:hypothetical protein
MEHSLLLFVHRYGRVTYKERASKVCLSVMFCVWGLCFYGYLPVCVNVEDTCVCVCVCVCVCECCCSVQHPAFFQETYCLLLYVSQVFIRLYPGMYHTHVPSPDQNLDQHSKNTIVFFEKRSHAVHGNK